MIKILYFASLRELLDMAEEQFELSADITTLDALRLFLAQRGENWKSALDGRIRVLAAVNQETAKPDTQIRDGDEIAFFPPVTGG